MKKTISVSLLALTVLLSSCSTQQFGAAATGSSLGGMFGSSIGGLMGGWRGSNKGTLAGMVIGGAIGVATTTPRKDKTRSSADDYEAERDVAQYNRHSSSAYIKGDKDEIYTDENDTQVQYGTYNRPEFRSGVATISDLRGLRVSNVHFLDSNDDQCLEKNEEAYIILDIKNYGDKMLYNITPLVTCNNSRVMISPAATITSLGPGRGVRYKTAVRARRKLSAEPLQFRVEFTNNQDLVLAKKFIIRTC